MVIRFATELRRAKGEEIASTCRIRKIKDGWIVPSQTSYESNLVMFKDGKPTCTCLDFGIRQIKCKHIFAVESFLKKTIENEKNKPKTERKTYKQNWPSYDEAQQNEKSLFMRLLADMCSEIEEPTYMFGRPPVPFSDMAFCCAFKVYSLYSLRRFTTDMEIARERGFVDKVPCFTSVGKFFQNRRMTKILMDLITRSSLPLKSVETSFAIDSSGISTMRFSPYYDFKYGKTTKYRNWIKVNLVCGIKTNIVTAVKPSQEYDNDILFFKNLTRKTAENFDIKEMSADKAYSSKDNLNLIDNLGGTPYIPFKKGTTGKRRGSGSKLWNKMFYYFLYNHDEFQQHYHKRSNAESTFHMIKTKFGDSVRSKTRMAQINEVLCKILCHNICVLIQEMHELGIEPNFIS
jgi:transposase